MRGLLHALRGRLGLAGRLALVLAAVALALATVLPIWRVLLIAPQYPEGLNLWISAKELSGDLQGVNILNHYIGMRPLSTESFAEFTWLPTVLLILAGLHLAAALIGRRELVLPVWLCLLAFDLYMVWDLYRWMYDWGHDLDPRAPMTVAPFMPPVIGTKQIANFRVWSLPTWGGWMIVLASLAGPWLVLHAAGVWRRWRSSWRERASRPSRWRRVIRSKESSSRRDPAA